MLVYLDLALAFRKRDAVTIIASIVCTFMMIESTRQASSHDFSHIFWVKARSSLDDSAVQCQVTWFVCFLKGRDSWHWNFVQYNATYILMVILLASIATYWWFYLKDTSLHNALYALCRLLPEDRIGQVSSSSRSNQKQEASSTDSVHRHTG